MREAAIGSVRVSQVGSTPAAIQRDARHVRSDPRESLILSIFLSGGGTVLQGAEPTPVPAGSAYLLDSDRAYSARFDRRYDMLALRLPRRNTVLEGRALEDLTGRSIGPRTPEVGVIRSRVAQLLTVDPACSAGLVAEQDLLAELVNLLAHRLRWPERPRPRLSADALAAHAGWFMSGNLADPAFGVDDVAGVYGVSRRSLELAFSSAGTGPAAHLRTLRLRRASPLLARDTRLPARRRRGGRNLADADAHRHPRTDVDAHALTGAVVSVAFAARGTTPYRRFAKQARSRDAATSW